MLILLFNQGLINGMVPYDAHISFEGHISGAVVGSVFALIFKNKAKTEQIVYPWMLEEDDDEDGLWNIKKHFNQDEE